jgi:HlyD family secretion protein
MQPVTPSSTPDPELTRTLGLGSARRWTRVAKRTIWIGLAVGVVVLTWRWWQARSTPRPIAYVTAPVVRGDLTVTVTATGTLEARNLVKIGSEASGKVAVVHVHENDVVTQGQCWPNSIASYSSPRVAQARGGTTGRSRCRMNPIDALRHE